MNIVDGLALFMARKKIKGKELARILECSDSSVSLYLSGKSGISLEKLSMLFRNGMTLEEAFGEEVAKAIRKSLGEDSKGDCDSLKIVVEGLRKILEALDSQMVKNLDEPRKT